MLTWNEFSDFCRKARGSPGLASALVPHVAGALAGAGERPPVIWLECMTCTGDTLSVWNTLHPDMRQLLFEVIDLRFQNTPMFAEGEVAIAALEQTAEEASGRFILIVEGTIPTRDDGLYGLIAQRPDGRPITNLQAVRFLGQRAKAVLAFGACAAFGGPYAAAPNPSRSLSAQQVLRQRRVINVPGCPVHPDWAVGTLSHVLLFGEPELDSFGRPVLFFGDTIHDNCPRRQHFENSIFARHPGDDGCLYLIGCKGPVTHSDCPTRQWSSQHNNWPVEANTPCIGCTAPRFPDDMSPFFEHLHDIRLPGVTARARSVGRAVGLLTALGIGVHLLGNIVSGRLGKKWVEGTVTSPVNVPGPRTRKPRRARRARR